MRNKIEWTFGLFIPKGKEMGRGRPAKLGEEERVRLVNLVKAQPGLSNAELCKVFFRESGIEAHEQTLLKSLKEAGIERVSSGEVVKVEAATGEVKRYGYTERHRGQLPEPSYPSSLTDKEWEVARDLFERPGGQGLPPRISRRELLDACCYVVRTGCAWRLLPNDFPPWQSVYSAFRRWHARGCFERMHDRFRALWRERVGRDKMPTAAVVDAQSTRHSPQGGASGFDAGKKIKGRKRHLVVDTLGLLLAVSVTAASVQDRDGAHPVIRRAMEKYPTIQTLFADGAYAGQCAQTISQCHGMDVQIVRHPANRNVGRFVNAQQFDLFTVPAHASGFVPLPKRWVVERTHAWNEKSRRQIMHHDRLTHVSEAWPWLTQARILMRRLFMF
jgi:transposase